MNTITAAMAAYEIAVGPTPEYQTAWRSWAVGVYEFVAGGDTACGSAENATGAATVTAAMSAYADKELISVASDLVWSSYTSKRGVGVIPGGDAQCEDTCSICGGPNTAAFEGDGWCDGCDQDARLDGDGDGGGGGGEG
jgi:hypothetical protein